MAAKSTEERLALIKENLAEFLNPEIIEAAINEGRNPRIYWGTATTGRPHAGYLVPGVKIAQYVAAGCDMVILLADIHGFLDNLKAPLELVNRRAEYYKFTITALLKACGVSTDKVTFVLGSSYQKSPEYIMDVYKLCSLTSEHDAKKAGAEVVKQSANSPLSGLLYPILQVLDEQYLDVDAQFGGLDQRKLFTAAKEWLPKLGYKQRAHLMNDMIPGLQGGKMSSSDENSKIDLLDPPDVITKKIKKAEAAPRVAEGNGLLAYVENVFLPVAELKGKREFIVLRERDGLEPLVYTDIAQIRSDYENDVLTPQLLKPAVIKALCDILIPIQEEYNASKEWHEIELLAYPPPEKKAKKVKKIGTRYPGATQDDATPNAATSDNTDGVAKLNLESNK
ncbi:tyrosyl-tRNA synthetase [Xylaria bambusicola]|uniref:tyrosyl-tRNA synthetase n=1 Tax=Xylaria bambusicola TaxID=326684 RepID=UPI002008E8DB|nr:tyrosyl-tRNA synthetase [Xylaria bambusicola]KAI0517523.1 tyrosyl-tRNA synthetase [Xylaria bambusicola]